MNDMWTVFWFVLAVANIGFAGINWENGNLLYVGLNGSVAFCCIFAGMRILNR